MLALGDEPLHAPRVRAGDLRALQRRGDAAAAPRAARRRSGCGSTGRRVLQVGDADHVRRRRARGRSGRGRGSAARSRSSATPRRSGRGTTRGPGMSARCLAVDLVHLRARGPGRSASETISTPGGASTAGGSGSAVRSSTTSSSRSISRKPRFSTKRIECGSSERTSSWRPSLPSSRPRAETRRSSASPIPLRAVRRHARSRPPRGTGRPACRGRRRSSRSRPARRRPARRGTRRSSRCCACRRFSSERPRARVDRAADVGDGEEILVRLGDGDLETRQRIWAKTRKVGRPTGSSENSGFTQPRSSVRWW